MNPIQIAALVIAGLSCLVAWLILATFARRKRRQRELMADDTPPGNVTPDGKRIFVANRFIVGLYLLLIATGTGLLLYGAFL